jgi:hypothetical protein
MSALHVAAHCDHSVICKMLIEEGKADQNLLDEDKKMPADRAKTGNLEM